jgi:HD-GYP domain-containing protein (c-di-GMP phosphodiesterase class II)
MQNLNSTLPELKQPVIDPHKLGVFITLLAVIGVIVVMMFASSEERREVLHWQNDLNLEADSRAADIENWLSLHMRELGEVANNPSLQIYLTTLETQKTSTETTDEPAQATYMRNLLLVTADRLGFISKSTDALKDVHANLRRPAGGTGLMILDNSGKLIVGTDDTGGLDSSLSAKIAKAPKGQATLIDMYTSASGEVRIGFILPIYAIQADPTPASQIGVLVGIKKVDDDFFKLLRHPGLIEKPPEAVLLRKEGDNVIYLSPQQDAAPLQTQMLLSTNGLDAAYAVESPGVFSTFTHDHFSRPVLMTSHIIEHTPWVLLLHIDRKQALAASSSWLKKWMAIMALGIVTLIASVWGAWWYGTSKRAMLLSEQTGRLAAHSIAQEKLLRLVTDNQSESIFIADKMNIVRFANERAARQFNISIADMVDKDLIALMGPGGAKDYIDANKMALRTNKTMGHTHRIGDAPNVHIIRSEHIPLAHIPIDSLPFPSPGVLVVDKDVTEIVMERERRIRTGRQLIDTLVRMVDARDPHAANHSASVSLVANEIAHAMGLDDTLTETAQIAGSLMNIGKIVIPPDMLTKTGKLEKSEVRTIQEAMQHTVTLLQGIDFDGPVVETLRQSQERFDGTGPLGLKGDEILITARIIAVSNSFVGMISPRSYRKAIDVEAAVTLLLKDIDTHFDRRIVVALVNFVENKQGKRILQEMALKKNDKQA